MNPLSPEQLLAWVSQQGPSASAADLKEFLVSHGKNAAFREARSRCALVRRVDAEIYAHLMQGLDAPPALTELVEAGGLEPDGPDRWRLEEDTRQRHLADWQAPATAPSWKRWNQELAGFFSQRTGPEAELDHLHHLIVADREAAATRFESAFHQADQTFDLPHCRALLEVLRRQARWIGSALAAALREKTQHLQARQLFYEDFFRTADFLDRPRLTRAWDRFLLGPPSRWILHLHATGGMGKTHFLRWLIARRLVPRRTPCARLDFDDFRLEDLVSHPMRILVELVDQLDRQLPEASLTPLLERLRREQEQPGWNPDLLAEVSRQLQGARILSEVVVILDTLEEATLAQGAWLESCLEHLRLLREGIPRLRLVLSGRYHLGERLPGFPAGETTVHEIPRFSTTESDRYLLARRIPDPGLREAIAARSEGNPFKLSLLAEIILNRPEYTPADVHALPSADLAYLIERVILRIPSQPLRWVIRYGAIPRTLTREFMAEVLVPPLRQALAGATSQDKPAVFQRTKTSGPIDVWVADPPALATLNPERLWEELRQYARQRGWLEAQGEGVRFHPEVVAPTRDLLRGQPIHTELHQSAAAFHLQRAGPRPKADVHHLREAVFHQFQTGEASASSWWETTIESLAATHPDVALEIATEPLGPEYASPGLVPQAIRVRAHTWAAELLARRAGLRPLAQSPEWPRFRDHVEQGARLAREHGLPAFSPDLQALAQAASQSNPAEAIRLIEQQLATTDAPPNAPGAVGPTAATTTSVLLRIQLAEFQFHIDPQAAIRLLRWILAHLQGPGRVFPNLTASDVLVRISEIVAAGIGTLGNLATSLGTDALQEALATLDLARESLDPTRRDSGIDLLLRTASLALDHGDLATAGSRLAELRSAAAPRARPNRGPSSEGTLDRRQYLLEARLALACEDATGALRALEHLLPGDPSQPALAAQASELAAQAHARHLEMDAAFDILERAAKLYDDARDPSAPPRLLALRLRILSFHQGNVASARALFDQADRLRSGASAAHTAEFAILRAWCLDQAGDSTAAARELAISFPGTAEEVAPGIRARLSLARAAFPGEPDTAREHLQQALDHLSRVQPPSARWSVLEDILAFPAASTPWPDVTEALAAALPPPSDQDPAVIARHLRLADLHRVFGDHSRAVQAMEQATALALQDPASPRLQGPLLQLLLASWRCPGPGPLRKRLLEAWFTPGAPRYTPTWIEPILQILRAEQWLSEGYTTESSECLVRAGNAFASRPQQDVWAIHLLELVLRVRATLPADSPVLREQETSDILAEIRRLRAHLGFAHTDGSAHPRPGPTPAPSPTPTKPLGNLVRIPGSIPDLIPNRTPIAWEPLLDRLLMDQAGLLGELSRGLGRQDVDWVPTEGVLFIALEPGPAAALPWELAQAGTSGCRIVRLPLPNASPQPVPPPTPQRHPLSIHLLRAQTHGMGRGSSNLEHTQGWSIETAYAATLHGSLEVTQDPDPSDLSSKLLKMPPAVLHLSAAVREFGGGLFLDFQSAEERTFARRGEYRGFWTATLLDRVLAGLPSPPFVILDILHPLNDAEALRMLLLRNLFAADLFGLGHTAGILGTGLAGPSDSPAPYQAMASALADGQAPVRLIRAIHPPESPAPAPTSPKALPLFPHASVLYTATPETPILPPVSAPH